MELTVPFSLTKTIHRQVPDSLQPEKHENRQDGKIVVITGGGTGIGAVSLSLETHEWKLIPKRQLHMCGCVLVLPVL